MVDGDTSRFDRSGPDHWGLHVESDAELDRWRLTAASSAASATARRRPLMAGISGPDGNPRLLTPGAELRLSPYTFVSRG